MNGFTDNKGMALIITLMIVALLTVVVVETNRHIRATIGSAAVFRDRITLSHMVWSGIQIGQAVLIDDRNENDVDSLQERWADPDALKEITAEFPFENGFIRLRITDLRGRMQVNALVDYPGGREFNENQRVLWYRFFELVNLSQGMDSEIKPVSIVNAIKDWLDYGDDDAVTGLDGAESDYYRDLSPPYQCRNGPVIDIRELALVKGIPADVFDAPDIAYGLDTCVTVFGRTEAAGGKGFSFDGRININTAPYFVLSALLPLDDAHLAIDIDEYRTEKSNDDYINDLTGLEWYKNVPGCADLSISADLITNRSDFFEIGVTAFVNKMQYSGTAAIRRQKDPETGKIVCQVLSYSE